MSAGVELVALAARTPVGLTAETSAAAVRARISRIAEFGFVARDGELIRAAADAKIDRRARGHERMLVLGLAVAEELARKLGEDRPYSGACRLHLELPEPRPGFREADVGRVSDAVAASLRARFPALRVEVSQRGHAGAAAAITDVLVGGGQDGVLHLVIGVDSYHHPDTFVWLEQERMLAGPEVRGGFFPGEAAAGLALAHPRLRERLRLAPLAVVRGASVAVEELGRSSETGSFGRGLAEAFGRAIAGLRLPDQEIDAVYLDVNGERYRSEEWGFLAMRYPHAGRSLDYVAPADSWGDVGAASGPLLAVLAARSWARGYARGPRAAALCGSLGGLRGAVVLEQPGLGAEQGEKR